MQIAELYVITLHIADGATPKRICFTGKNKGVPILRETPNCWYVSEQPHGLRERYRKAEEYKLLNNRFGIYMYGTDNDMLIKEWNNSTSVSNKK